MVLLWYIMASPTIPAELVQRAIELFAKKQNLPVETAEAIFKNSLYEALILNPRQISTLLGASWMQAFAELLAQRERAKENRRNWRTRQKAEDAKRASDERRATLDLSKLATANIKSGYQDVYANGEGWRARVKGPDGRWSFLKTRKYPEEAAQDRYEWLEVHAPSQMLPPLLRPLYEQYKHANMAATHEEALRWATETAQFLPSLEGPETEVEGDQAEVVVDQEAAKESPKEPPKEEESKEEAPFILSPTEQEKLSKLLHILRQPS